MIRFYFDEIKDWQQLHESSAEYAISERMGQYLFAIGIEKITEANWQEAYRRFLAADRLLSPSFVTPFTPAQVHRRIGLRANVNELTEAKFWQNLKDAFVQNTRPKIIAYLEHGEE